MREQLPCFLICGHVHAVHVRVHVRVHTKCNLIIPIHVCCGTDFFVLVQQEQSISQRAFFLGGGGGFYVLVQQEKRISQITKGLSTCNFTARAPYARAPFPYARVPFPYARAISQHMH